MNKAIELIKDNENYALYIRKGNNSFQLDIKTNTKSDCPKLIIVTLKNNYLVYIKIMEGIFYTLDEIREIILKKEKKNNLPSLFFRFSPYKFSLITLTKEVKESIIENDKGGFIYRKENLEGHDGKGKDFIFLPSDHLKYKKHYEVFC